jgi:hypothetical protein
MFNVLVFEHLLASFAFAVPSRGKPLPGNFVPATQARRASTKGSSPKAAANGVAV